jgi:hypothetical protein
MGCGESKDIDSVRFSFVLDPEEERLHLRNSREQSFRRRILKDDDKGVNDQCNAVQRALALRSALLRDDSMQSNNLEVSSSESADQDKQSGASTPCASLNEFADARREQLASEQEESKERALLELDPACWQRLAEQGSFQQAEDTLLAAAAAEERVRGRTARYARCLHGLAGVYDQRSNLDVTGQQQRLSLQAGYHANMHPSVRQAWCCC